MGDPVLMTVVGVGAALTKMFLRACDAASAADLIGDGQELLGTLLRALRRTDESRGQIERRVSQTLANRLQAMQRRYGSQSVDPVLLSGACTEVEIILDKIANDDALLLSAVRSPESFPEKLRDYAAERRTNVNLQLSHISTNSLRKPQHSTLLSPHGPPGFKLRRSRAFFLE